MKKVIFVGVLLAIGNACFWGGLAYEICIHWHDITAAVGGTAREVSDAYAKPQKPM